MSNSISVDTTVEGFPTPYLPKHLGKYDYSTIEETHQLLMENAALAKSDLGGG